MPEQHWVSASQGAFFERHRQLLSSPSVDPSQSLSNPSEQSVSVSGGSPQSVVQLHLSSPASHEPSPQQNGTGGASSQTHASWLQRASVQSTSPPQQYRPLALPFSFPRQSASHERQSSPFPGWQMPSPQPGGPLLMQSLGQLLQSSSGPHMPSPLHVSGTQAPIPSSQP
jgi:hypothetical protein